MKDDRQIIEFTVFGQIEQIPYNLPTLILEYEALNMNKQLMLTLPFILSRYSEPIECSSQQIHNYMI